MHHCRLHCPLKSSSSQCILKRNLCQFKWKSIKESNLKVNLCYFILDQLKCQLEPSRVLKGVPPRSVATGRGQWEPGGRGQD